MRKLIEKIKEVTGITNTLNKEELDEVILVYQMGKVGSRTVENSIRKVIGNRKAEIIHIHEIGGDYRKKYRSNYFFYAKSSKERIRLYLGYIVRKVYKHRFLSLVYKAKRVKIISLVREPIGRNVSALFQAYEFMNEGRQKNTEFDLNMLSKLFYEKVDHSAPEKWFDYEMKPNFGIDVYTEPFDFDNGYKVYTNGKVELLVVRLEDLEKNQKIIGDFLDLNEFKIVNKNIGEKKWYSQIYNKFKRQFKPTKEYLDNVLNTNYAKHFYTKDEIQRIYSKYGY